MFGLPGGGPNLDVVGAVGTVGLRFVLTHGETAACIMAGTYGLLTGRPAMALGTRGPGASSAANGAAQATLDRFPLLLVTDCVPSSDWARVAHQRLDQQSLFAPITKWSGRLASSANAAHAARAALDLAGAAPLGAVHLDYDPDGETTIAPPAVVAPISTDDIVERAAAMIAAAKRPVALVGIDAIASTPAVIAAVERLACPVLSTYQAAGILPEGHPQLGGLYTNGIIESALLNQADLVIAIGFDQVEPMPSPWRYQVPVVSVSDVPACSTQTPVAVEVIGPLAEMLHCLVSTGATTWSATAGTDALRGCSRRARGDERRRFWAARACPRGCHRNTSRSNGHRRRRRALSGDHAVLAGPRRSAC